MRRAHRKIAPIGHLPKMYHSCGVLLGESVYMDLQWLVFGINGNTRRVGVGG